MFFEEFVWNFMDGFMEVSSDILLWIMEPLAGIVEFIHEIMLMCIALISPFLGIIVAGLIIYLIGVIISLIWAAIVDFYIILTTKKVVERVYATVIDKYTVSDSDSTVFTGEGFIYIPSSTEYRIQLRYNNCIDSINSSSLYSSVRIGDVVPVRYIRRFDRKGRVVKSYLKK